MTPSLGLVVGLPVAGLVLLIAIPLLGYAIYKWRTEQWYGDEAALVGGGAAAAIVATFVITGFAMWPWSAEYHYWKRTDGTISAINSRLVGSGDGMNQRFVVTFTDGRQRACDDTRCSTLKVGDRLTLMCKRAYQWGASPGYDCNWVKAETGSRS